MKRPWDAVAWWEIRRFPFNLFILVLGLASGFISTFVGSRVFGPDQDIGSPFMQAAFYAIAANLCYTLGWITELLWAWGNTAQTETIRPKVFRVGLFFSASLTLSPAITISLIWAVHRFRWSIQNRWDDKGRSPSPDDVMLPLCDDLMIWGIKHQGHHAKLAQSVSPAS